MILSKIKTSHAIFCKMKKQKIPWWLIPTGAELLDSAGGKPGKTTIWLTYPCKDAECPGVLLVRARDILDSL